MLNVGSKTFVEHVGIRKQEKMLVHSKKQVQVQVVALIFDKLLLRSRQNIPTIASSFQRKTQWNSEHIGMNDHFIKLEEGKQPLFRPIYSLGPVELETLKMYIETNLANGFIWPFKSPAKALILFNQKPDKSLCLCIDYWGLNNHYQKPISASSDWRVAELAWLGKEIHPIESYQCLSLDKDL